MWTTCSQSDVGESSIWTSRWNGFMMYMTGLRITKSALRVSAVASQALACREGTPEDMIKAMRLYRPIKRICKEEKLSAVTVSCFKLIERTGTTGCLALAMLNDEGIIAGCEGDLQSVFTLLVAKALTGKVGFMANPSMINARNNEIIFTIAQSE